PSRGSLTTQPHHLSSTRVARNRCPAHPGSAIRVRSAREWRARSDSGQPVHCRNASPLGRGDEVRSERPRRRRELIPPPRSIPKWLSRERKLPLADVLGKVV